MGKVRPNYIKNISKEIMKSYSDRVTTDFQLNKYLVEEVTDIESKSLLNRISGHLVTLKRKEHESILPPKK